MTSKLATTLAMLIVGGLAAVAVPDALATPLSVQYAVSVNAADPGLVVQTMDLADNPYVDDLTVGVPVTFSLFRIWTEETAVTLGEDNIFKLATVQWTFSSPAGAALSVGVTHGTTFFGLFDAAEVLWASPTVVNFATGAQLHISLSEEQFNATSLSSLFFDLTPGIEHGADVKATFLLTRAPVPEPASLTLLGLALGGAWATRRRHRTRP